MGSLPSADPGALEVLERARVVRQRRVLAGLLLTFAGLFLMLATLPVAVGPLLRALPLVAAGLLSTWLGGILLGVSRGSGRRRR